MVTRDGGDRKGHYVRRKRRFPAYIESIRSLLEGRALISSVDRQILEYVTEGKTMKWIADKLGMKKPTVFIRIAKFRRNYGVDGPGPGR